MLGTNDCWGDRSSSDYAANIAQGAAAYVAADIKVILNQPPFATPGVTVGGQLFSDARINLLRDYCAELPALADDVDIFLGDTFAFEWFANNQSQLSDGVHPSQAGVDVLGTLWAKGAERALGLAPFDSDIAAAVWAYADRTLTA